MKDSSINGILIESILSLEKNLGNVELKINDLFMAINSLLEFSSKSGNNLIEIQKAVEVLKQNLIYKEDILTQFYTIHEHIERLSSILGEKSTEISSLLISFSDRLDKIEDKIENLSSCESFKNKKGSKK